MLIDMLNLGSKSPAVCEVWTRLPDSWVSLSERISRNYLSLFNLVAFEMLHQAGGAKTFISASMRRHRVRVSHASAFRCSFALSVNFKAA